MISKLYKNKLIIIILGSFLGLLVIESLLRGIEFLGQNQLLGLKPMRTSLVWVEDPQIGKFLLSPNSSGWFVTPTKEYFNFVKTNNEGFYDSEHAATKPNDTYRILFLGDSFVASLQTLLNDTFFKKLERQLNNLGFKKRIEIISMGLGDTGTAEQYIALKLLGLKYKPDLVIQMFLTANDFKNNSPVLQNDPYRPYFLIGKDGSLLEIPHLKRKDQKFYQIKEFIKQIRLVEFYLFARQNLSASSSADHQIYDEYYNKDLADSVLITEKLILATKDLVEKQNSKYIVTVLANNEQVNMTAWNQFKQIYHGLEMAKVNLEKPDNLVKKICQNNNLNCFFMLPFFKNFIQNNSQMKTHYLKDGHWNQTGTNLAADFLTESLLIYFKQYETNL